MSFLNKLKTTIHNEMNESTTENGALGYRTTGKCLLDMHFAVASLRNATENDIVNAFMKAYFDDRKMALKWLFYARDVRGGLGERRLFRTVLSHLATQNAELPIAELIQLIPLYGRFDDVLVLIDTDYRSDVIALIRDQLSADVEAMQQDENVSLLAKWLPSVNTSSEKSRSMGRLIASGLGMSEKEYRKTLSSLRAHLDVVERKMSADQFGDIRYEAVPSKANIIYRDAFLRHDQQRRHAFLESLKKGESKINAGTLFPHDIVHAYMSGYKVGAYDETLEQLWKSQKNTTEGIENTIVVADGSGSMMVPVGDASCTALSVANALAIYFAERNKGPFADQYITFSTHPQLVDLSKGRNLKEKLQIALLHNEVANTDIYKVFQLILQTAQRHKMKQDELPKNIIIISDMEFDGCAKNADGKLFEQIKTEYRRRGYKLPRLVFWNVNSRTGTLPVKENTLGVALVSGFSANIFKMVLSNQLDPYQALLEVLNVKRYEAIEELMAQ